MTAASVEGVSRRNFSTGVPLGFGMKLAQRENLSYEKRLQIEMTMWKV